MNVVEKKRPGRLAALYVHSVTAAIKKDPFHAASLFDAAAEEYGREAAIRAKIRMPDAAAKFRGKQAQAILNAGKAELDGTGLLSFSSSVSQAEQQLRAAQAGELVNGFKGAHRSIMLKAVGDLERLSESQQKTAARLWEQALEETDGTGARGLLLRQASALGELARTYGRMHRMLKEVAGAGEFAEKVHRLMVAAKEKSAEANAFARMV